MAVHTSASILPAELNNELEANTVKHAKELYSPLAEEVAKLCGYTKQVEVNPTVDIAFNTITQKWDTNIALSLSFPDLDRYDIFNTVISELVITGFSQLLQKGRG